jgi:hypothetical protein
VSEKFPRIVELSSLYVAVFIDETIPSERLYDFPKIDGENLSF